MVTTEPRPLHGQVAVVVGAAGVIGSAVVRRLAADGAQVVLMDRGLPQAPDGHLSLVVDVSDSSSVAEAFEAARAVSGRIDILVSVAGVTSAGSFEAISDEEWSRVMEVNLRGVFLCNRAVVAEMKTAGYGRIINIGSVLAKNGGNPRPWLNADEQLSAANAAYGAAKAGVHAMTLYLAKELAGHNITVNAVAPGPIGSPMTTRLPPSVIEQIPVGRLGTADEVAHAVAFLGHPASGFITGEILDVNGGLWVD